ncbi:MAG: molecular chaperone DnaJ [Tepidisphaeraceae bacterium]
MPTANAKRDYYEVLGVAKSATADEIKRAYRKLAMQYHPDRVGDGDKAAAEVKFKEAAEAYEILSDDAKRKRYDQAGFAGVSGQAHDYQHMDVGDIFSMFEEMFAGGGFPGFGGAQRRGNARPTRGYDLETQVELTLNEVATGAEKTIEFERQDKCETCSGSGAKPGTQPALCPQCGGQGRVAQAGLGGMFRMVTTCPQCRGRGQVIRDRCNDCHGSGRQNKKRVVTIKIPAGVQEGQAVRVQGEGEPGEGNSPAGDLHCYIVIKPHEVFARHGNDIACQVAISFTQAALGATIEVPTLKGVDHLEIPAGAQHGDLFKLKGKGLPDLRSYKTGDEIVQVVIEIPQKLTDRQRDLLQQFADTEDLDVAGASEKKKDGFGKKLKEMFGGK